MIDALWGVAPLSASTGIGEDRGSPTPIYGCDSVLSLPVLDSTRDHLVPADRPDHESLRRWKKARVTLTSNDPRYREKPTSSLYKQCPQPGLSCSSTQVGWLTPAASRRRAGAVVGRRVRRRWQLNPARRQSLWVAPSQFPGEAGGLIRDHRPSNNEIGLPIRDSFYRKFQVYHSL